MQRQAAGREYQTSHIKRHRSTKAEVAARRDALFEIVSAMKPMTVRQVFYQATVRDIVEKSETPHAACGGRPMTAALSAPHTRTGAP